MGQEPRRKGHPKGLYILFATEMWERFNYYGMRAILIYFMTDALLFNKEFASNMYGGYTGLAYLSCLVGGYMADRFWGNRRSIVAGGLIMALAEFVLFACGSLYKSAPELSHILFFAGLGIMVAGYGFFKPNISSMVGQLYSKDDNRKDAAFTIFYMGINVGAMIGPLICGLVGNTGNPADFKWAFLAAGIGMLISVVTLQWLKNKYVVSPDGKPVGETPEHMAGSTHGLKRTYGIGAIVLYIALAIIGLGLIYLHAKKIFDISYLLLIALIVILFIIFTDKTLTKIERHRVIVIFIVSFFVIFFWSAFEQAGASLSFFADEQTNLELNLGFLKYKVPPAWFQSLNSAFLLIFALPFAWLWTKLGRKNMEPSSPFKMALGLLLLAAGYLFIAWGVNGITPSMKVSMIWLTGMYAFHTWGELCLSPIGLSLVSKLAPVKFTSLLMAVWFMANAAANVLAGKLSALYPPGPHEIKQADMFGINLEGILNGSLKPTAQQVSLLREQGIPYTFKSIFGFQINNLHEFFLLFAIMAGAAALILFLLTRLLSKMMHGMK